MDAMVDSVARAVRELAHMAGDPRFQEFQRVNNSNRFCMSLRADRNLSTAEIQAVNNALAEEMANHESPETNMGCQINHLWDGHRHFFYGYQALSRGNKAISANKGTGLTAIFMGVGNADPRPYVLIS
jgi:hypothetical protein